MAKKLFKIGMALLVMLLLVSCKKTPIVDGAGNTVYAHGVKAGESFNENIDIKVETFTDKDLNIVKEHLEGFISKNELLTQDIIDVEYTAYSYQSNLGGITNVRHSIVIIYNK